MAPNVDYYEPQDPNGYKDFFSLLVKGVGLFAALFFILCMPMGDPDSLCQHTEDIETQANCTGGSMQSYACSLHAVLINAATSTNSLIKHSSQFMACVMLNALYDAKMKKDKNAAHLILDRVNTVKERIVKNGSLNSLVETLSKRH